MPWQDIRREDLEQGLRVVAGASRRPRRVPTSHPKGSLT